MNTEKKTILMIPSWYPTKGNPINGSFFREQALALKDNFYFKVLHINYKKTLFTPYFYLKLKKQKFAEVNSEQNITEYNVTIYKSIFFRLFAKLSYIPKRIEKSEEKQVKTILKRNSNFSFDYVYGLTAQDMAEISERFARSRNKPLILAEHAPFPWPGNTINNLTRRAFEKADLFLAISNDKIRQVLLQNIKLKNIKYIGNLVDETIFSAKQIVPVNKTEKVKTFIIVAANSFYKNYDMFIKVFNRLSQITNIPFKTMVVGYNANKGYSENAEELEKKLKNSLFSDKIELIEYVPRNELTSVYHKADCFIITSIQEGQPVSALEAACCGLPIFSTKCGGVEDYVDDKIGRIYNITDYENFALGLKDYLEDKIKFDNEYIRNTIIKKFGRNVFIDNFTNFINELK